MVGIPINFISVACWMCDLEEKSRRTIKENVKEVIKLEFVQFVNVIGQGLAKIDAHYALMMIYRTTLS